MDRRLHDHDDSQVIPFGKAHKGKSIANCPSSYLRWIVDTFESDIQYHYLAEAAEEELNHRDHYKCHFEED